MVDERTPQEGLLLQMGYTFIGEHDLPIASDMTGNVTIPHIRHLQNLLEEKGFHGEYMIHLLFKKADNGIEEFVAKVYAR